MSRTGDDVIAPEHANRCRALPAAVGPTPLVELHPRPALPAGARLLAKLESVHPGGSIKDRPVRRILTRAVERGDLDGGRRVLDSSSGNAGIAYAMLGASMGLDVTLVVPGNASLERLERIRAHGAEVVLTDPLEGYDHAVREAQRLAREQPERYWYANQYANEDNWRAHYETTATEILEQVLELTGGLPAAFVAGVGTGGTLTGVGRRLREAAAGIRIAAVVPELFPGIEGLKPLGSPGDLVPEILDASLIDERFPVSIEQALTASRWLARDGLFVGPSSGAFVHAAVALARGGGRRTVVTVLSDSGDRYGSTGMWGRDAAPGAATGRRPSSTWGSTAQSPAPEYAGPGRSFGSRAGAAPPGGAGDGGETGVFRL